MVMMGWGGSGWLCPGFDHEGPQQTNNQTRSRLPPVRLITSLIDYFGCSLYENPYGSLAGACCLHGGAVYSNLVPMSRRADPMCYFVCRDDRIGVSGVEREIPGPGQIVEKRMTDILGVLARTVS